MYKRRYGKPRTFTRRYSRFRRGLKSVTETKRWETANFYIEDLIFDEGTGGYHTNAVVLASINNVFSGTAWSITGQRNSMRDAARGIELGGIVYQIGINTAWADTTMGEPLVPSGINWGHVLYVDHIETDVDDGGSPIIQLYDWNRNFTPITTNPGRDDTELPTRILHRDSEPVHLFHSSSTATTQPDTNAYGNGPVYPRRAFQKRIRSRLDDSQALILQTWYDNSFIWDTTIVEYFISGTLYWRLRF